MKITGVYTITNMRNGKLYVGSSSRNVFERFGKHRRLLLLNKHTNSYLQRAWNKYNKCFKFELLEVCSKEKCIEREQYYIDLLNPEYNLAKIAGSTLGVRFSEETKDKIRQKALGRECKTKGICFHTKEGSQKIWDTLHKKYLYHFDSKMNLINIYPSILSASKKLKINRSTLKDMVYKRRPLFKNKYKDDIFEIREYESYSPDSKNFKKIK